MQNPRSCSEYFRADSSDQVRGLAGRTNTSELTGRQPSNHNDAPRLSRCRRCEGSRKASISQVRSHGSSGVFLSRAWILSITSNWPAVGPYVARRAGPSRSSAPSATIRVRWLFTLVADSPRGEASRISCAALSLRPARTRIPTIVVRLGPFIYDCNIVRYRILFAIISEELMR